MRQIFKETEQAYEEGYKACDAKYKERLEEVLHQAEIYKNGIAFLSKEIAKNKDRIRELKSIMNTFIGFVSEEIHQHIADEINGEKKEKNDLA